MNCLDSGQSAMERQHNLRGLFPRNDRHEGLQSADAGWIDTALSEEEPQKSVRNGGSLPNGELEDEEVDIYLPVLVLQLWRRISKTEKR